jgi:hypothetical protein
MKSNSQKTSKSINNTTETRLARIERYVGQHKGETKSTFSGFGYVPTTVGGTFLVSGLPQGDQLNERTGLMVNLHRILRHIVFQMTSSCTIRTILFRDRFNIGAFPAVTELLESADPSSTYHFRNVVQSKRFVILHDESQNFTLGGKLSHSSLKSIPHNCSIKYGGTGSAVTDVRANAIFLLVISDTSTPGNINITTQLQYTDE